MTTVDQKRLQEFISYHGLSYKQNSRSFIFTCPKCNKDQKLYMEKKSGRFVCWICSQIDGYRGRPEFALADLSRTPLAEVKKFLYGDNYSGTAMELDLRLSDLFDDGEEIDEDWVEIPEMDFPFDFYPIDHPFSKRGVDYLATRDISLDLAQEYHLRYAPALRRVVFPVELGDRVVGWQERTILPSKNWDPEKEKFVESPKMLSSKDIPTAHVVMFANRLVGSKHVVVCEGPIDAMKAHLCGGNVATMGKGIGQGQVKTIRNPERLSQQQVGAFRNGGIERIYLGLDPDAARETARLIREFSDMEVYLMHPPKGYKDLGEMPYDKVLDLFRNAPRVGAGHLSIHVR